MPARILIVQNNLESPAGLVQEETERLGIESTVLLGDERLELPAGAAGHDGLLILGGTMNALADDACPYFPPLRALARRMDAEHRPVMGICLGAQILARAWGGIPRIGAAPEYGFVPLHPTEAAQADPLLSQVRPGTAFMQWHDDTFDLPPDATLLMRGQTCTNQIWRAGNATYGFQAHIEVTAPILVAWGLLRLQMTGDERAPELLRAATDRHLPEADQGGRAIARGFAALVLRNAARRRNDGAG
ncbi:type 1 glutamine amidotransferase [Geminicoccus roseus]|uniref:type 1 glutamine amidotransferase n=1 Tax=Geminicoccus roseus TaxID=404900 RepID=UPI0003FEC68E|nr:type 1 glutamine amidotransferase [Geminicoccus roseus]